MLFLESKSEYLPYLQDGFYCEEFKALNAAMDAPEWVPCGAVWATHEGELFCASYPRGFAAWSQPSSRYCGYFARSTRESKPKGGARPGAGRKPLDSDGTVVTTVRLTKKQKAAFDSAGGVTWLRKQLDLFDA